MHLLPRRFQRILIAQRVWVSLVCFRLPTAVLPYEESALGLVVGFVCKGVGCPKCFAERWTFAVWPRRSRLRVHVLDISFSEQYLDAAGGRFHPHALLFTKPRQDAMENAYSHVQRFLRILTYF